MVFLFLIFICALWFCIAKWMDTKKYNNCSYEGGMVGSIVVAVVFLLIGGLINIFSVYRQNYSFEEYKKVGSNIVILEERRDSLSVKLGGLLSEKFLDQESKLFEGMTPDNIDLLLVKYPEIKSNLTLMELVRNIVEFNNDVYAKRLDLNDIELQIRMRYKNPWVFKIFLPSIPHDLGISI